MDIDKTLDKTLDEVSLFLHAEISHSPFQRLSPLNPELVVVDLVEVPLVLKSLVLALSLVALLPVPVLVPAVVQALHYLQLLHRLLQLTKS
jgi:hypothetical protein